MNGYLNKGYLCKDALKRDIDWLQVMVEGPLSFGKVQDSRSGGCRLEPR